jgi:hypothetical protein
MYKQSVTQLPLSPEEQYEASSHFGRSLFSALQLARAREARRQDEMMGDYDFENDDVLRIPIPEHLMPHQMPHKTAAHPSSEGDGFLSRALSQQSHPLRMVVGGQEGFRDAKKDYYMQEKARIHQELAQAQREYIDLLSKIKTGSDEETPNVDAFCNGLAHAAVFGKEASHHDVGIEEGSIRRLSGDVGGFVRRHTPFVDPAIDMAASGLLNTGAGAAYLTYLLRKKMREEPEEYMKDKLPTRVELQPYA